ncbi:MAG: hypothetical protein ACE5GJ_10735 [Gemmatimonadota bacterium]
MVLPLVLTILLLAVAGVTGLRSASRAGLGLHLPSLLCLVAMFALFPLLLPGAADPGRAMAFMAVGIAIVVGSGVHLWVRLRGQRARRARTEASRLAVYVRYLSRDIPDGEDSSERAQDPTTER